MRQPQIHRRARDAREPNVRRRQSRRVRRHGLRASQGRDGRATRVVTRRAQALPARVQEARARRRPRRVRPNDEARRPRPRRRQDRRPMPRRRGEQGLAGDDGTEPVAHRATRAVRGGEQMGGIVPPWDLRAIRGRPDERRGVLRRAVGHSNARVVRVNRGLERWEPTTERVGGVQPAREPRAGVRGVWWRRRVRPRQSRRGHSDLRRPRRRG